MFSPGDWVAAAARRVPDREALRVAGRTWSYAELDRYVDEQVARLRDAGLKPGDRLATLLDNGVLAAALPHAALRLGATLVPLNTRLTPAEIEWQLADCKPRLLIRGESDWVAVDTPPHPAPTTPHPLTVIYTSGTTGRPKGAMLSAANFAASAAASAAILGVHDDDRWLAVLPLFHVGGLSILYRAAMQGTGVVVHERFDARAANESIDRDGVSIASLVSVTLERLLDDRADRAVPRSFRCALVGGGPVPRPLLERCVRLHVPVAQTYGLTEATSQVATLVPNEAARHIGSVGHPLPGTEVRIDGGDDGEILVRGPTVMSGYLDDAHATAVALRDGWLHTGDMGRIDDEGYLFILDRRDDLIVTGGENVYPAEVESVLAAHPGVEEAGVIGEPDAQWGKRVVAIVRLRGDEPAITADAIVTFCRERLAGYKAPREVRFTSSPLPRTASGKLQRSRLRDLE